MIGYAILSAIIALIIYKLIGMLLLRHTLNKLPGPPLRWLMNIHQISPDRVDEFVAYSNDYGGLIRVFLAPWMAWVIVSDSKYVKTVLKASTPKGEGYYAMVPWLGDGLLLASGKKWARSRRLLTPAFHFDILKPYMDVYNEATNTLVGVLSKHAATGEYFDIMPKISRLTMDVIVRCAMSIESNCQIDYSNNPYVNAVNTISYLIMERQVMPHHRIEFIYRLSKQGRQFYSLVNLLHRRAEEVIHERRLALEGSEVAPHQAKYRDFLDILLTTKDENGVALTDKEIRDEVDTFMFEGHDTTGHGINWSLYCLGKHPDIQQRCREEIDALLGDTTRDLTWADMEKLEYTQMCIREAMRMYPPVPIVGRTLLEDTDFDGMVVPAGTTTVVSMIGLHRNPKLFDNPMEYRPSRFSPEEAKDHDAFSYVPFSAGPRNCIGQVFASHEMKIAVAKVLRRFIIEVDPDHEIRLYLALVLRSTTGIRVRLRERTH